MAKSRADIQKAYRERKKQKGPEFLEKERARVKEYYVPAATMNKRKLATRNEKAKMRNRKSRERKRNLQTESMQADPVSDTSGYGTCNTVNESDDDYIQAGPSNVPLIIKLPNINKAKSLKKSRGRALARTRKSMSSLKAEIVALRRKVKTKNTQLLRINKKMNYLNNSSSNKTPQRRTCMDLDQLKLTPKRKGIARRKLLLGNVLMAELDEAKQVSSQKERKLLHNIVAGKITKKYRCVSAVSQGLGLSRKSLYKCSSKTLKVLPETRKCLSKNIEDQVRTFLEREDNCRVQPGKSDAKTMQSGLKKQTIVLTDYMKNLHLKFLAENSDVRFSRATFCRLRPKNVLLAAFISRNACLCLRHQNMAHKVQALKKLGLRISENPENLLLHLENLDELLIDLPENVKFKVWKRVPLENGVQKMKIVDEDMSKGAFSTMFKEHVDQFGKHVERVRKQYRELRNLKENLPCHEMILQMDFAENFACRSLDEVQTAYWNQTAVTLHPVVIYFQQNEKLCHQSCVIVSDDTNHSATTVLTYIDVLMPHLKTLDENVRVVHYWTDSPSSQYRNRFIFDTVANHMTLYGIEARWNFFAAGHGKGPCDGLGGTTKMMADEAIRQGNAVIQDSGDFFKWAKSSSMKEVTFFFVGKTSIDEKKQQVSKRNIKPVKHTMKLHAVWGGTDPSKLRTQETSCYCQKCVVSDFCSFWNVVDVPLSVPEQSTGIPLASSSVQVAANDDSTPEQPRQAVSTTEQPPQAVSTPEQPTDISLSSNPEQPPQAVSTTEQPLQSASTPEQPTDISLSSNDGSTLSHSIEPGSYVAATYDGEWYVGEVEDVDNADNDCEINFMMKTKNMFKWPARPDKVWVKQSSVLCNLHPLIHAVPSGERIEHRFSLL